ncbi:MAG: DNA polymerase III subunit delta [Steroidobacteraceae bacterium]
MRTTPDKVDTLLAKELAPAWLVAGEEPLQSGEACDAIRAAARRRGFLEREQFFIDRYTPWADVLQSAQALSLFASQRLVEIRMPNGKPGTGAAILQQLVEASGPELLVLVICEKLDRDARGSSWVGAIEARGVHVSAQPVPPERFPQWLAQRAQRLGLALDADAAALLAQFTEGNLLAADQEIRKLLLTGLDCADATVVLDSVSTSSRFDVTRLTELALAGDLSGALRVMASLRAEGTEPPLVLWAILREMRYLWTQLQPGPGLPAVWTTSAAASATAAQRLRRSARGGTFERLAERAARADRIAKGQQHGAVWDEIALLLAELAGARALPMPLASA